MSLHITFFDDRHYLGRAYDQHFNVWFWRPDEVSSGGAGVAVRFWKVGAQIGVHWGIR